MINTIKLYIVDIEENTISKLQSLFYKNQDLGIEIIGYALNYSQCINDFSIAKNADLFLVSAYLPDTMGIELIEQIKKINPKALVLVTLTENTKNLAETAIAKGADDYISKPFKARLLLDKIDFLFNGEDTEAFEISEEKDTSFSLQQEEEEINKPKQPHSFNRVTNKSMKEILQSPNSFLPKDEEEDSVNKPNRVIVFSSTGSYGKSTLLANSAIAINKLSSFSPKICIVDFNLLYPSVLYKFHHDDLIPSKKNIFDLFDDINDLKPNLIESALYTHEPTGIKILHTPSEMIRDYSKVTQDSINQLISHLRSLFDLVLIDTSSNIKDDFSSFPIIIADKTFIVLEPDLASILHTHKLINLLKLFETNLDEKIVPKINLVLNKESARHKVDLELIKKSLMNLDISVTIPDDPNITSLSNDGKFIIDSNTASTRHIKTLANKIYPLNLGSHDIEQNSSNPTQKIMDSVLNLFNNKKKK